MASVKQRLLDAGIAGNPARSFLILALTRALASMPQKWAVHIRLLPYKTLWEMRAKMLDDRLFDSLSCSYMKLINIHVER